VDAYAVSNVQEPETRFIIKILYLVFNCIVLALLFGFIPFAWFFYESSGIDNNSVAKRIGYALKYSIFVIFIVVILIIVGTFLRSTDDIVGTDPPSIWAQKILAEGREVSTVSFTLSCVTIIGYIIWCTYTAYGLASLPIDLIKGNKSLQQEKNELDGDIKINRIKNMDSDVPLIADEERTLDTYNKRKEKLERVGGYWYKMRNTCRPIFILLGIFGLIVSVSIMASITLSVIDRILNHLDCGVKCGLILKNAALFNPLDRLLLTLSNYFPVDYIFFSLIVIYIFCATLYSIVEIGIHCFCWKLFSVRPHHTDPQAIMLATILLILSILAMNNSLENIAPIYVNYGSQTYIPVNGTVPQSCSIAGSTDCVMTEIGFIIHNVDINVGIFGIIFYAFNCIFLVAFLMSLIMAGVKARQSNIQYYSDEEEE